MTNIKGDAFSMTWSFGILLALLTAFNAHATDVPPPVDNFFKSYTYQGMALSPSGHYLAVLYPANETLNLAVIDLDNKRSAGITNYAKTGRVTWLSWKSDNRLLFGLKATNHGIYRYSVNSIRRDGSDLREIAEDTGSGIISWLQNDPTHILYSAQAGQPDHVEALKIYIGDSDDKPTPFGERIPAKVTLVQAPYCRYIADNDGEVRVCATTEADGRSRVLYRDPGAATWREIAFTSATAPGFIVLGFTRDNKHLYALSNEKRDTLALYEVDPTDATGGRLLFEGPDVDLAAGVYSSDHQLMGVRYIDDRADVHYFNPNAVQLQHDLSDAFPGERIDIVSTSPAWKRAVILVTSDRSPGRYYLYDRLQGTVEEIAKRAPWINDKETAEVRPVRFEARDKLPLSGYLTLPRGREPKNLPLIVNPHGGPLGVRDSARWQPDAQFLASRGYAVLQVNFRGSGGFGKALRESGVGEFGERMLDDVTDATNWAVAQGIADKSRICIYGASYGGYLALMGLVNHPDLYRCGISYSGLTDLHGLFSEEVRGTVVHRERSTQEIDFWKHVVGTHENDRSYLTSHSPVYNADKIKAPVFIAHGGLDVIVPSSQASRMESALKSAGNKHVEYLYRYDEGHGFSYDSNRIELYREIEKFLLTYNPPD
jgi:dipeptidyl aminopeptidase/acylaminoacyl peptidase